MYIKKIILAIFLLGLVGAGIFSYYVYQALFSPNTNFETDTKVIFIPTGSSYTELNEMIHPLVKDIYSFDKIAERKGYTKNIKAGRYVLRKGMNNNQLVNTLRSQNTPVAVRFNNQERLEDLAGRISTQIEADSTALVKAFTDPEFLKANDFSLATALAMYVPNQYECFWNTSAIQFRKRMLKEYQRFWNTERKEKAAALEMSPQEVITLAAIVQKETAKVDERPRVAGVYINRLKTNETAKLLQADPTVIYAIKQHREDWEVVIKRVLYKDLELDNPYNTYKYAGLPPGPITMPDISAIDAVLNYEHHEYYYFVANVERFGYHKFAKTIAQHNRNKEQYVRWITKQGVRR